MGRVLANCKLLINPVDLQHEGSYSSALVRGICPARRPLVQNGMLPLGVRYDNINKLIALLSRYAQVDAIKASPIKQALKVTK